MAVVGASAYLWSSTNVGKPNPSFPRMDRVAPSTVQYVAFDGDRAGTVAGGAEADGCRALRRCGS